MTPTQDNIKLAVVFPPGEFIKDALEANSWTQEDLAIILDRPLQSINLIINGKKSITPDTAMGLGNAFSTSAELWLNLESEYRLSKVKTPSEHIQRKSRIYSLIPLRDVLKKGWVKNTTNLRTLENRVCQFLEIEDINDIPTLNLAARKSDSYREFTPGQVAWYFRARQIAKTIKAKKYNPEFFLKDVFELTTISTDESNMRKLPRMLSDAGIRFVLVDHLPNTKIDGAAFWLDNDMPVIALSLRYDRIDHFWFTLMHELAHIYMDDSKKGYIDENLVGKDALSSEDKPANELKADRFASSWLIPQKRFNDFINKTKPYYSKQQISKFANNLSIHPGLVVGQLQHAKEIGYNHSREYLIKMNHLFT